MKKEEISEALKEYAELLELSGENPFKIKAYYDASRILLSIEDLEKTIKENRLEKIKGIGQSISNFIKIYYEKGTHPQLEELRKKFPPSLLELLQIPGLGPKKVFILNKELGISSILDLKYAIYENRLSGIPGFGAKTQEKIRENLKFYESIRGSILLNNGIELINEIKEIYPFLTEVGELRRKMPVISSFEFILKGKKLLDFAEILNKNLKEKNENFIVFNYKNFDIKVYPEGKNFFKTLIEKTGSEKHLKEMGEVPENLNSEEEFYERNEMDFIPPEMREGIGEIKIAKERRIKDIVSFEGIKGTLHNHTTESDGASSIEDYIKVAKRMGLSFIGIADHSKSAKYAGGLEVERLLKQNEEVKKLNKEKEFLILHGVECDILPDGSLDYEDWVLKKLDYVVVSIHSHFNFEKEKQMFRIIKAISNPYIKIFGHPEGRLLLGRKGYEVDVEVVLKKLGEEKKWVELNSNPMRLDLDWKYLQTAQKEGVFVVINPDAHYAEDLKDLHYGILMGRKGLLFKENCVNFWDNEKLKKELGI